MNRIAVASLTALALTAACSDEPLPVEPSVDFAKASPHVRGPSLRGTAIATGARHACAVGVDRETYCWGDNLDGQLGDGSNTASGTPVLVQGGLKFAELTSGGRNHTCGLTDGGEVWCWGQNPFGQLGDGSTVDRNVPVRAAPDLTFQTVDAGTYHTCGIATDGKAYCWGSNGPTTADDLAGTAFGTPTTLLCDNPAKPYRGDEWRCSTTPVEVPGPALSDISAGLWATCGVTASGDAYCTGWNRIWALGSGTGDYAAEMTPVSGGLSFDAVNLGVHGCGLVGDAAYCWGGRFFTNGQTGNGTMDGSSTPALVAGGLSWASVYPTDANNIYAFTCGLTTSKNAYCWGNNRAGGLGTEALLETCPAGDGSWQCSPEPVPVSGGIRFIALSTGNEFACGVGQDRAVYCWGRNDYGQLGDGTTTNQFAPVMVQAPDLRGKRVVPAMVYVVNGDSDDVSVISTADNTVVATVAVGDVSPSPYHAGIAAITPDGTSVYVANYESGDVSVISTVANRVVATVAVGAGPNALAITPDGALVYVANLGSSDLSVISTSTKKKLATIALGAIPRALAITPDGEHVYVIAGTNVAVISTATNAVTTTVGVGAGPYQLAITPDGAFVYVVNAGSDDVSVISTATATVVATVPVGNLPRAVAVTPDGAFVYVANRITADVSVISTASNNVVATVGVATSPFGIAITPDGTLAYVANGGGEVSVIATATNTVVANFDLGFYASFMAITPDGTLVYVANRGSGEVSMISTATNNVVATIGVGTSPVDIVIKP